MYDSYGDGFFTDNNTFEISDDSGNILLEGINPNTDFDMYVEQFCLDLNGCTDPSACNYEADANADDGSCYYSPLDVNSCEILFCDTQEGEQWTNDDPIEYLNIPITESGTLNELYYNINWHNQGYIGGGGVPGPYSTVTIKLYNENNLWIETLQNLYDPNATPAYINFEDTDSYDISVQAGYSISIEANSSYGWESYINLAQVSLQLMFLQVHNLLLT